MLKTLDVLIGLSVVMLLVSMAVTVLTQCVLGLCNLRGKHLLRGIEAILVQIDPNLKEHATEIGKAVLTHPLIGPATGKLSGVIGRSELVAVLMEIAGGKGTVPDARKGIMLWLSGEKGPEALTPLAKNALTLALSNAGIKQPDVVLDNVYATALKLEGSNPELAAHVRHTMAIVQEAPGVFVARLNGWFDQTMDRVTEAFTYNTRKVTAVCALVVAVGLQLDTIDLFRRLSTDDELRKAVANQSAAVLAEYDKTSTAGGKQPPATDPANVKQAKERLQQYAVTGYQLWPDEWKLSDLFGKKLPGVLLTTLLLSLGAPFWFNALKNLINLRPMLAGKEEAAREDRRTEQQPPPAAGPSPAATGEQGNLSSAG